MVIFQIYVNLVRTGDVTIQSSVRQGWKLGVEGAKAVVIAVGDNFIHSDTRLGDFT